jgi:hypothetical protein
MAISIQDIVLSKRRYLNAASLDAASRQLSMAFYSWLAQQGGTPELQVVEFSALIGTTTVIADAACKVYAIVLQKTTTTSASAKFTDHASTGSATAFAFGLTQTTVKVDSIFFPKGLPMANGVSALSNTTMAGSTTSAAGDGAAGIVLLGNP